MFRIPLGDRATRCSVGWYGGATYDHTVVQQLVDTAPPAQQYFSDGNPVYGDVVYAPGTYTMRHTKQQTYRVEAVNADLRHYLARLGRKSRCFSRCIVALQQAVRVFVSAYNRRQLHKRHYPKYPAHLRDFVPVED